MTRGSRGVPLDAMRVLGSYALVLSVYGRAIYRDERREPTPVGPGTFILVFPGVAHAYGPPPGGRWDEAYVVFDGGVFDAWRSAGLIRPERCLLERQPVDYWLHRLTHAAGTGHGDDPSAAIDEALRLQGLLAGILAAGKTPGEEGAAWLSRARHAVEQTPDDGAAAATLGMGYDAFRKRFARLAGTPPARYRAGKRIERACDLLQHDDAPLKQIAQTLGFCDEFHFSRRFRQLVGVSPREFRERTRR